MVWPNTTISTNATNRYGDIIIVSILLRPCIAYIKDKREYYWIVGITLTFISTTSSLWYADTL
jgi:hypothetical protein